MGALFAQGVGDGHEISPRDVRQGEIGDCWLTAGMAALARASPDAIRRMVRDDGDGTYDVTLQVARFGRGKEARVVRVDGPLPSRDGGASPVYGRGLDADELWPALVEKACATLVGGYGPLFRGRNAAAGLDALVAGEVSTHRVRGQEPDALLGALAGALAARRPVVLAIEAPRGMPAKQAAADLGLTFPHAYSLEGVDESARTLTIRNSQRDDDVVTIAVADLQTYFVQYALGPAL